MFALDLALRGAARTCRLRVGRGVLGALVDELAADPPGRPLVLIADARVARLHASALSRSLRRRGLAVELLTFPSGEASKVRETKSRLEDRMFRAGVGRDAAIVAVGGGVTGDLAGFVAATWHRGIPVIQVPTSLVAMVDAAIGGKTGVDLPGGKNLVGAFHQPLAVFADVELLDTLPDEFYVEGFAEVIKSAAIADATLFGTLERSADALRRRDGDALERVVAACVRIKARFVRSDEREAGRRAALNFGHTIGHAVETVTRYRERHGRAVAYGLCVEARLAADTLGFPDAHVRRLADLIGAFDLPTRRPRGVSGERILAATRRDKKARAGRVRYALPARLGRMPAGGDVTTTPADAAVRRALSAVGQRPGHL